MCDYEYFGLPGEWEAEQYEEDIPFEEDEGTFDPYYDENSEGWDDGQPSELTEWLDYDPDC